MPSRDSIVDDDLIFTVVEQLAEFKGGMEGLYDFVAKNIDYKKINGKINGKVFAQFIIEKDGSVTNVEIIRSLHPDADTEVLRMINLMPPWKPGMQNGRPVRSKFVLPMTFR